MWRFFIFFGFSCGCVEVRSGLVFFIGYIKIAVGSVGVYFKCVGIFLMC